MGTSSTKKSNVYPRSIGQNNSMVLQRRYIDDSLVTVSSSGSKENNYAFSYEVVNVKKEVSYGR